MLIETETGDDRTPPGPDRLKRAKRHAWHAVMVLASPSACCAAQACKGQRFLSCEAPKLPMTACDAARCECRYRHFEDRRGKPRRADEKGAGLRARVPVNRRASRGRRATD
jgi:hypothetical protein